MLNLRRATRVIGRAEALNSNTGSTYERNQSVYPERAGGCRDQRSGKNRRFERRERQYDHRLRSQSRRATARGLREPFKIEAVCRDDLKQTLVRTIMEAARTGRHGDGKIFVSDIGEAWRIESKEVITTP